MTGGKAAAAAFDPLPLSPGLYGYDPVINASFDIAGAEFGGLSFSGGDSRFDPVPLFVDETPLWQLSIWGLGDAATVSDLEVEFSIDPAAQSAVPGQSALQDAQGAAIDEGAVESAVRAAIAGSGGLFSLANFHLFPLGTTYYLDQSADYSYGVEALVEAQSVPEPSTLCLAAVSAIVCCGLRMRHKFRPRPDANG
jgi:hypothetical protein